MSTTAERNRKIHNILDSLYLQATEENCHIDETLYKTSMDKLFDTTAWGFREIVLVVVVGMKLNPKYKASKELYNCNPRAIYEGPIKEFFIEKQIPHRKSGPLNVAKATVGLDMAWATQRRPSDVAKAVVNIIDYLEKDENIDNRVNDIGVSLFRRLIASAKSLTALTVNIDPQNDPDYIYNLCYELITKTPDSGNTPQKIVAFLLESYHNSFHTNIIVTGGEDRASVTSTTSKKPGDINEEYNGYIYKVYEVTVKHFDIARIRDSFDCISIYNEINDTKISEIIVICRKNDCPHGMIQSGLNCYLAKYIYQNVTYYFCDIFEWLSILLQHITEGGRQEFYSLLNNYINDFNTSLSVKELWQQLHNQ